MNLDTLTNEQLTRECDRRCMVFSRAAVAEGPYTPPKRYEAAWKKYEVAIDEMRRRGLNPFEVK